MSPLLLRPRLSASCSQAYHAIHRPFIDMRMYIMTDVQRAVV